MLGLFKLSRFAKRADRDTRLLSEADFTIVDTELTGLDEKRDTIVSIGAVRMNGSRINIKDTFYRLANPRAELKRESILVHGITPSDIQQKPDAKTVLEEFCRYCGDSVIVGHFICIDMEFINNELKAAGMQTMKNRTIDTFAIYEWIKKRITDHACFELMPNSNALYEISKCFDIPISGAHNSEMDAFITAQLFQRFMPLFEEFGIRTVDELLAISDLSIRGGDKFCKATETSNF
ncbi:MAG: 3'-5' exonuclease [Nitrospiraceae bacterium]|nr:3'-5' exonuclease [Nitrospiraceae bacterium]